MDEHTHTELEFPTALFDDNGKTIAQKLWVIEQMDCDRAGLVQEDAEDRMKACESLVDLMAPVTSTVASMVASWVAPMETSMVAPVASMVAPVASMVTSMASMASMASMVGALEVAVSSVQK